MPPPWPGPWASA